MPDQPVYQEPARHGLETIALKVLGYMLLLLGVVAIVSITFNIWSLYNHPGLVVHFTESLQSIAGGEQVPPSLLQIAAWLIVILLMLTAGKIAVWLIEAGQSLIKINSSQ